MTEPSHQRDRQGWALRRLLDIHDGLRSDLVRLRRAVAAVAEDGQDVDTATAAVGGLSFRQPGWMLRRFCAGAMTPVKRPHLPVLLLAAAGVALLVRRRWPGGVFVTTAGLGLAYYAAGNPDGPACARVAHRHLYRGRAGR